MEEQNRLYRSNRSKMIGGVAGGLSEYFKVDVVIFRLLFVLLLLFSGGGLLAYVILWIVIPRRPMYFEASRVGSTAEMHTPPASSPSHTNRAPRALLSGLILIFLGLLFLFDNLTPWYHIRDFWPLALVFAGFFILYPNILQSNSIHHSNTNKL